MKIHDLQKSRQQLPGDGPAVEKKKAEMAMEFERMFARQLVQEMTKGLFKKDDNQGMMTSGNEMYRNHIVDTLSQALAEQEKLGMSDMISKYWDQKTDKIEAVSKSNT